MAQSQVGFDEAIRAIRAGTARPHKLWVLVAHENQRDHYALKPSPWEGAGEYQHVDFDGDDSRLIRLPEHGPRLTAIAAQVSA